MMYSQYVFMDIFNIFIFNISTQRVINFRNEKLLSP